MSVTLISTQTKLLLLLTRNKTQLLQTVLEQRPVLAAQQDKTSSARKCIGLVKKDVYPDHTIAQLASALGEEKLYE